MVVLISVHIYNMRAELMGFIGIRIISKVNFSAINYEVSIYWNRIQTFAFISAFSFLLRRNKEGQASQCRRHEL